MMSEARPLPSHTTTGMGGSSLRLSRAMEMTLGPPSTIRHTRGTPWPKPGKQQKLSLKPIHPLIALVSPYDHRTLKVKCWSRRRRCKCQQEKAGGGRQWSQWWQLSIPLLSLPYPSSRHRMTKGSPQVTEGLSIHKCNKTQWLTLAHTWRMDDDIYDICGCTVRLTSVNLLQGDVLLQQSTQFDLRAILPTGAIVSQDEVGVAVVENSQLAQWVCHCLIGSGDLEKKRKKSEMFQEENILFWETTCSCKCSHIFSDEVLLVFQDPPRSNSYCTHLPSWLGRMVL